MNWKFHSLVFLSICSSMLGSDIAVVSLAVGSEYKKNVEIGIANKQLYCKKHGYDFICPEECLDLSRPIPWSKILLIEKTLHESNYKWVFWTDADSLIMNLDIKLETLIDEDYDMIIGTDLNGVNSGNFFIKNSSWSLELLSDIYSHTECIDHPFWEQQGLMLELEKNPDKFLNKMKIVPQQLFNSYPFEIAGSCLGSFYQIGDFIVHFPGTKNLDHLQSLFIKYQKYVVDATQSCDLDLYLAKAGFYVSPLHSNINEGYMTESQKRQFSTWLQQHPHIKKITEIGLNAGHSAENFFQNCPQLELLISFDIEKHPYTKIAREYLENKYKDRTLFIPGDSAITLPEFVKNRTAPKCDLIYIDGSHSYEGTLSDIINTQQLAHENTILWIDDYFNPSTRQALHECHRKQIIEIIDIHSSSDP